MITSGWNDDAVAALTTTRPFCRYMQRHREFIGFLNAVFSKRF